ncbi:MAG: S24 family peptidase, partial [Sulfuricurvum sp.]|nr:S24 family peptidase [Sulfuricurvum sp.]
IFTIRTEHGLFIKRIQVRIDGKLDIISDNKDYPISIAMRNEVEIVGRVVGRFGAVE